MEKIKQVADLKGHILSAVEQKGDDELYFTLTDGREFKLYHSQDCCESVRIEDVVGDLQDLVGSPLLNAEEFIFDEDPEGNNQYHHESFTYTYYKFATVKGYVDIRWYGGSNGFYSESVDFTQVN